MQEQFSRTAMLLGEKATEKLHSARVAIFGLGGVGGYALEALCRSKDFVESLLLLIIAFVSVRSIAFSLDDLSTLLSVIFVSITSFTL